MRMQADSCCASVSKGNCSGRLNNRMRTGIGMGYSSYADNEKSNCLKNKTDIKIGFWQWGANKWRI